MKITVVIPAHPARIANGMLQQALCSVEAQTRRPDEVQVELDYRGLGSAATRNAAFRRVTTDWVAFLDSDDLMFPQHLELLERCAQETDADLVYPWFAHDPERQDPYPGRFGQPFDAQALMRANYIPITVLVRTRLVQSAGWFRPDFSVAPPAQCDDWGLWKRMLHTISREWGPPKFVHLPERTWAWRIHGGNTSGSPELGDAKRYDRARPALV